MAGSSGQLVVHDDDSGFMLMHSSLESKGPIR